MAILGNNTIGSSAFNSAGYGLAGYWMSDSEGGNIDSFHCAIAAVGSPANIKMGIYATDVDGSPDGHALIEEVEIIATVSDDVSISAPAGSAILPNTTYAIVFTSEDPATTLKYDSIGPGLLQTGLVYGNEMSDPGVFSDPNDLNFSLWVEYSSGSVAVGNPSNYYAQMQ